MNKCAADSENRMHKGKYDLKYLNNLINLKNKKIHVSYFLIFSKHEYYIPWIFFNGSFYASLIPWCGSLPSFFILFMISIYIYIWWKTGCHNVTQNNKKIYLGIIVFKH